MEDLAAEIVSGIEPSAGWGNDDSQQRLNEVVLALLEELDPDTVEESVRTIADVIESEHGR